MNEVTRILNGIEASGTQAAEQLLPLVYDEMRRLATSKMASEREGHTLQPTALVHEAYVKLLGPDGESLAWNGRAHFFSAAAEAMLRILIDSARRKSTQKRGSGFERTTWDESRFMEELPSDEILAIDEALAKLENHRPEFAKLVKLRYFAGLSVVETAAAMEISERSAHRMWRSARAWLLREMSEGRDEG